VLSLPVRHDEALEVHLVLQDSVYHLAVLARIAVVHLLVRAHDRLLVISKKRMSTSSQDVHTADVCTNRICKRPGVKLMEGPVIDVTGNGLVYIISKASGIGDLTKVLLQTIVRLQYCRYIKGSRTCSLPMKCLAVATTPCSRISPRCRG
jgi:hypothetical protein